MLSGPKHSGGSGITPGAVWPLESIEIVKLGAACALVPIERAASTAQSFNQLAAAIRIAVLGS
jgi:hypothetical protein